MDRTAINDPRYRLFRQTIAEIIASQIKTSTRAVAGVLSPRDGATNADIKKQWRQT